MKGSKVADGARKRHARAPASKPDGLNGLSKVITRASELTAHPNNPRQITDEQLDMLREAMREFGDLSGVIRNETSGNLIGGHQRVKILGEAEITITQRFETPTKQGTVAEGFATYEGERFVYREVRWNTSKEKAAMIAANKHGGEWLVPNLKSLLKELDGVEMDITLTGFTGEDMERMFAESDNNVLYEQAVQLKPQREYVVILCESEEEFETLKDKLELRLVRRGGYKPGSVMDHVGLERVVTFKRLAKVLC